jgi:chromate reductase, NAD(P)H dehydrogenase (quinone)
LRGVREVGGQGRAGRKSTAMAQQHLRNVFAYLDMPTLAQPEAFIQFKEGLVDESGNIGEANKQFMQNWMDRSIAWVKKHTE